jgi:hypothetical protein
VAVINVSMDGQVQADNVVQLTGKAGDILPSLLARAFDAHV